MKPLIQDPPVLEQLSDAVKWWNADEAEEPDVRRLFAACKAEIEHLQGRLRDEEERHALLQSRCYEGFASATDGIFDALQAQDDQVEVLREALQWALCHAEEREGDTDFHAEYAKAYAALRVPEGEGFGK